MSCAGGSPVRPRVVIVGGGVAALETMLALRDTLDAVVSIDIVTPSDRFQYRPLSVAEPFGLAEPRSFDLAAIASEQGVQLHRRVIQAIHPDRKQVCVRDGPSLSYDAALIAAGAQTREWLPGAIHFAGPEDVARIRALVAELDAGEVGSVVFTAPGALSWTLPLYELALLTAAHISEQGLRDVRLTVLTPEAQPLEAFGPAAGAHIRELFVNRGITLRTRQQAHSHAQGRLTLLFDQYIEADRVVALPEIHGEPIAGLPHDDDGFIPVDDHCAVLGVPAVYAAGDITSYPIKQGGLACQQADAAAEAIAVAFGATLKPRPFEPILRGQLLTGLIPTYMTADVSASKSASRHDREPVVAVNPLWWPPSKIVGRYLAPYLAEHALLLGGEPTQPQEHPTSPEQAPQAQRARDDDASGMALAFAERDAEHGDYVSALEWLHMVEQLSGPLAPELEDKRAAWRQQLE